VLVISPSCLAVIAYLDWCVDETCASLRIGLQTHLEGIEKEREPPCHATSLVGLPMTKLGNELVARLYNGAQTKARWEVLTVPGTFSLVLFTKNVSATSGRWQSSNSLQGAQAQKRLDRQTHASVRPVCFSNGSG
jgi:hypothetical protein